MEQGLQKSLAELMQPDRMVKQARYENALRAVTMAYQYAEHISYVEDTKVKNADGSTDYFSATLDVKAGELVKAARLLIPLIENDLNETLKRLD